MMQPTNTAAILLMVDDDSEDIYLTKRAFSAHDDLLDFRSVKSGSELFDYLNCRGDFEDNTDEDIPDVILLDINIPKENGFSLLERLKDEDNLSHLPVSMLTTSNSAKDVRKAYQLGASSYICKSTSAEGMKELAAIFCSYWFNFAKLPRA